MQPHSPGMLVRMQVAGAQSWMTDLSVGESVMAATVAVMVAIAAAAAECLSHSVWCPSPYLPLGWKVLLYSIACLETYSWLNSNDIPLPLHMKNERISCCCCKAVNLLNSRDRLNSGRGLEVMV